MSTNRYTAPIPSGAIIAETREQLNNIVTANPKTALYDELGGFFLKDDNGTTVAVAADALIPELEDAFVEVSALIEKEKLEGENTCDDKKVDGDDEEEREIKA